MSSQNPDVDAEMLMNLNLLSNYDSLDSEDLWDDFIKNFSEFDQTEQELEDENQ